MYSIIFCYRNREDHLNINIPNVKKLLIDKNIDHELIVVEQNDNKKFRRGNLLNEGVKQASGDIVILHDIDYYPVDVEYYKGNLDAFLPVKKVLFTYNNLQEKPILEVPSGYRHFKDSVDDNFHGGVSTFTKEAFLRIGGFNWEFTGWGFEDSDLRERCGHYGLTIARGDGIFYALDHPDSGPASGDMDFSRNIWLWQDWRNHLHNTIHNQPSTVNVITPKHSLVDKWILAKDFTPPFSMNNDIVSSAILEEDIEL